MLPWAPPWDGALAAFGHWRRCPLRGFPGIPSNSLGTSRTESCRLAGSLKRVSAFPRRVPRRPSSGPSRMKACAAAGETPPLPAAPALSSPSPATCSSPAPSLGGGRPAAAGGAPWRRVSGGALVSVAGGQWGSLSSPTFPGYGGSQSLPQHPGQEELAWGPISPRQGRLMGLGASSLPPSLPAATVSASELSLTEVRDQPLRRLDPALMPLPDTAAGLEWSSLVSAAKAYEGKGVRLLPSSWPGRRRGSPGRGRGSLALLARRRGRASGPRASWLLGASLALGASALPGQP